MFPRIAFLTTSLMVTTGAAMAETTAADVEAACNAASNLPAAVCTCMGERAMTELNDAQRTLLVAGFNGNEALAASTRATMPPMDMIGMANFATDTPMACMREVN
jgi:hypothetical protein